VAQQFARDYPMRVRGLVLACTYAYNMLSRRERLEGMLAPWFVRICKAQPSATTCPSRSRWTRFALGVIQISSGASPGHEGPTVWICAGITSMFGRLAALRRQHQCQLLPVSVAAGIASAFNAWRRLVKATFYSSPLGATGLVPAIKECQQFGRCSQPQIGGAGAGISA
jgi:hypothetical protein